MDDTASAHATASGEEPAGRPIAEYALLSDCSSATLLHRDYRPTGAIVAAPTTSLP
jgi:GH15 family glucan-1,4-alpha-glucosidase